MPVQSPRPTDAASRLDPQQCFVFRLNHFDPIWRRCWDRDFIDAGRRFVSYRAIEEAWIDEAIRSCADGVSCFMVEATWVLRHYVQRHPEQLPTLRKLTSEGRFELLGSGENIVDANLIHGETLARNLILGTLWGQETLGVRPLTGWHSDGFGSSAQMPQIFRQCGYRWLPALSYNTPDAPYWRGLDGSIIFFSPDAGRTPSTPGQARFTQRIATASQIYHKHPPCPQCQGHGCPACKQRGFLEGDRAEFSAPPKERLPGQVGVLMLWGEEFLPGLHIEEDIARFNSARPEFNVRQGIYRDIERFIADDLKHLDNPPAEQISSKIENNAHATGCYVTRIAIKQHHRAAEHALLAAERWDALLNNGQGAAALRESWRNMTLSAFHDAITSSHVDPAYTELMDLLAGVSEVAVNVAAGATARVLRPREHTFTIFNAHAHAATAPVSVPIPADWSGATVTADGKPLLAVRDSADTPAGQESVSFLAQ